ncbi:MAG: hypothetical protein QW194_01205 [Candidatus Micrarchaeaceae archaeon]|nr:hypothetical protein [Candidatus Marsarchaeota archaeon]
MAKSVDLDESRIADFIDVLMLAQARGSKSSGLSITVHADVLRRVLENESRNSCFHAHTIEGTVWIKYDQVLPSGTMIRLFRVEDKDDGRVQITEDAMSHDANLIRRMER